ncbi:SGNH/GDSL hydrolase family protein [Micromonospora sp. CPCC 205371]|nr:SGNH/GDSL hydrolase family protein [Micromonospora sp. CPCC 205371]
MHRPWTSALLAVAALVALACKEGGASADPEPSSGSTPRGDLPSSMAALGDSVTSGFGTCLALVKCHRNSWSTGESARIDSHYRRIKEDNEAIDGRAYNHSVPGARASGLTAQARQAVQSKVEYVTVLIGANDACRTNVADMTPVASFRSSVDEALAVLKKGLPKARVLVVSVPDLNRLWEIGHRDERAVKAWRGGICPALLANPTSTAKADADRRAAVGKRVDGYNSQLAAACKAYGKRCVYDGGAVHRVRFTLDMLNRLDYFHPDAEGQQKLAEVTFGRAFR